MRRIVLLWLILTPIWIAFSFYASVSKIAFVPPALVVVALALHWLHKHFVVAVAGEPEPRPNPARPEPIRADSWPSQSLDVRRIARPSRSLLRPALVAVGIGACFGGAAMAFVHAHRSDAQTGAAAGAIEPNAISVQTEAVKPQPSVAEAKPVQTEALKPQSPGAEAKVQDNATPASPHDADAKRADAQISEAQTRSGQTASNPPRCNISLCESYYQSFRASDCTYQPYSGPRQYCGR
jgi:BA14K-like protein